MCRIEPEDATCDPFGFVEDADGGSTATVVATLGGDLGPLLLALAGPNEGPDALGWCTADLEIVPVLWLVDATGDAIRPAGPRTACGKTKPGVREAIADLDVVDTEVLRQVRIDMDLPAEVLR